jgi:hypothetical protein
METDGYLNYIVEIQLYVTASVSIRKSSWLMLFREIITTDHEQCEKHINSSCDKVLSFFTLQWVVRVINITMGGACN